MPTQPDQNSPDPVAAENTARIVQLVLTLLRSRLTPVLAIVVAGAVHKLITALPSSQIWIDGYSQTEIVSYIMSGLLVVAAFGVRWLLKKLSDRVQFVQQLLDIKGLPVGSKDGFFGPQTLRAVISAINAPAVNITPSDTKEANQRAK